MNQSDCLSLLPPRRLRSLTVVLAVLASLTAMSASAALVAGTKTVSGTFPAGSVVTYTVTLTNLDTVAQTDNAGSEFTDVLPSSLTLVSAIASSGVASVGANTVTWNGGVAPLGGSVTITITATVNSVPPATVVSNQGMIQFDVDANGTNESLTPTDDPGTGAPFDPTSFIVAGSVVTGTKTASGAFSVGGTVTYTVTLTNSGNLAAGDNAGNEFTDVLPTSLTLVSANASSGTTVATIATRTVTWNGSIPAAGSVTITITATVNSVPLATVVSNQGTIQYDADANGTNESSTPTDDPGTGAANDPTSFVVVGAAVTGTKTASGTFNVGGTVTYAVTLMNSGNVAAGDNAGNEFTDVLPTSLTLVSANASSGTAVATIATRTVTWNGSIPAAGSVTITITATINSVPPATVVSNQGTIQYDADANGTNESSTPTDDPGTGAANDPTSFVVAGAAVTGTKTASGTFNVGGTVTYTVTLTNSGNLAAGDNAGNEFTDVLPTSLTLVSANASSGTAVATIATRTVTWNGGIPAAGSVTITITATINSVPLATVVSNQGTIQYDADANGTNESSRVTDDPGTGAANDPTSFVVAGSVVTGTKTASGTFNVGGTVTYTVTLTNSGNLAAGDNAGNEFTDVLPTSLTLVSANASSGTAVATIATRTVTWNGSIPAAGSVTITITATINSVPVATVVSNQGTIQYDADANGTNESSTPTDDPGTGAANDPTSFVVAGAAVTGTKTASGTFNPGGTVTYTITLTNSGNASTSDNAGNEFTDVLPTSLTLVSANASSGTAVATIATRTVTWNGGIPAAGSVTITITATINAGTGGTTISNQGSVSYDADTNGTNEANALTDDPGTGAANDPTAFTVAGTASNGVTKAVAGTFVVGTDITYTVVISNAGVAASGDNPGNELTDVLPTQLTLVSASATSGTTVATIATNTVTWNGSVPAGGSVTVTITATINNVAGGTSVSNQASHSYDSDANGTNNATVLSDDPGTAAPNDPTVFVVLEQIPTMNPLALLVLAMFLATIAFRTLRG